MTTMDPQWALLAGALVFIITPGIALFYGGRERATSMVNMMCYLLALSLLQRLYGLCGGGH